MNAKSCGFLSYTSRLIFLLLLENVISVHGKRLVKGLKAIRILYLK